MIKNIQNWLDVRKQYKLEQQRQELIRVAKVIISNIMREFVKYDIQFTYRMKEATKMFVCGISYGEQFIDLDLCVFPDTIKIEHGEITIATYEHLKWYQIFKKSTKKKFYHAEDAVRAISNMIIMGEVEYQEKFGGNK
jgi:hypothetical protein